MLNAGVINSQIGKQDSSSDYETNKIRKTKEVVKQKPRKISRWNNKNQKEQGEKTEK